MDQIGIANLPNQLHKITSKKGANFTLMLVGASGLGKSSFINTLFTTSLLDSKPLVHQMPGQEGVAIEISQVVIEEKQFKVNLTLINTPGYNSRINNENSQLPIIKFVKDQHESYLRQESSPSRGNYLDLRVHACLYFINPSQATLSQLDVITLTQLSPLVNVIPVIAKSDTLTKSQLQRLKDNVRGCISAYQLQVYACPVDSDDEDSRNRNIDVLSAIPFAITSGTPIMKDGKKIIGREYPWGIVEVENDDHCDFKKLRTLLIRTHMHDLIETTQEIHYENYRQNRFNDPNGATSRDQFDSHLKKEEEKFRQRLAEKVQVEEVRFRVWEQKLVTERDRLMKNLEMEHAQLRSLLQEVDAMEKPGQ